MADRVAIIGGSTPGRDHFPSPAVVPDNPLAGNFNYEAEWTLANMVFPFYRIKTWRVVIASNLGNLILPAVQDWVYQNESGWNPGGLDAILPTTESDLIVGNTDRWVDLNFVYDPSGPGYLPNAGTNGNPDAGSYFGGSPSTTFAIATEHVLFLHYGLPLWTPSEEFTFEVIVSGEIDASYGNNPSFFASPFQIGTVSLGSGASGGSTSVSRLYAETGAPLTFLNIFVAPWEYWPYANSEGLPVYNTSTGAQLRDPLS